MNPRLHPLVRLSSAWLAAACWLLVSVGLAQTTTAEPPILTLSTIEVKATAGAGYRVSNAMSATKSNRALVDIPASVAVASRDFIDDMSVQQSIGDVLKYITAGSPPATNRNDFVQLRGQRFEAPFQDGRRVMNVTADMSAIDSVEIIKGSNAVLYGTRVPAGGLVNRITKKPETEQRETLTLRAGSWDSLRTELDVTGAVPGSDDHLAYRLIGAWQDDAGYRQFFDQRSLAPMLQYAAGDTTLRYQLLWSDNDTSGELPNGVAQADGTPYTGGGRDEEYRAPWSYTHKDTANHLFTWIQKLDRWESRVAVGREVYHRDEEDHRRQGAADFVTGLSPHRYFGQTQKRLFDAVQFDLTGSYEIGGIEISTNAGASIEREKFLNDRQEVNLATGVRIGTYSRVTNQTPAQGLLSITAPNLAAVQLPGVVDRIQLGRYNETRNVITSSTAYLVQSFDAWSERLQVTLGAGYATEKSDLNNLPDASQAAASFQTEDKKWVYSAGAVFHVTSRTNLYAQTGTVFSPNQASATTPAGIRPPAVTGRSSEIGVKGNFFTGRLSIGLAAYELNLDNFATFNSTIGAFVVNNTRNQGIEADIFFQPTESLQVIATWFNADISGSSGAPVNQSYENAWSLWSKYSWTRGALAGFGLGLGAFHRGEMKYATGARSPGYTTVDASVGYRAERWSFQLFAKNLTDELYNIGSTGADNIDISSPLSFTGTLTWHF